MTNDNRRSVYAPRPIIPFVTDIVYKSNAMSGRPRDITDTRGYEVIHAHSRANEYHKRHVYAAGVMVCRSAVGSRRFWHSAHITSIRGHGFLHR